MHKSSFITTVLCSEFSTASIVLFQSAHLLENLVVNSKSQSVDFPPSSISIPRFPTMPSISKTLMAALAIGAVQCAPTRRADSNDGVLASQITTPLEVERLAKLLTKDGQELLSAADIAKATVVDLNIPDRTVPGSNGGYVSEVSFVRNFRVLIFTVSYDYKPAAVTNTKVIRRISKNCQSCIQVSSTRNLVLSDLVVSCYLTFIRVRNVIKIY